MLEGGQALDELDFVLDETPRGKGERRLRFGGELRHRNRSKGNDER